MVEIFSNSFGQSRNDCKWMSRRKKILSDNFADNYSNSHTDEAQNQELAMNFQTVVVTENSSKALSQAQTALEQLGYKLKSQTSAIETYKRGTFLGALVALSPKGWQSTVYLQLVPSGLSIRLVVNMFGKVEVSCGVRYWQAELNHICSLANGEQSDVRNVKFKRPPVLKIISIMLVINVIALAIGAIVAMVFSNTIFVTIIGGLGLSISIRKVEKYW